MLALYGADELYFEARNGENFEDQGATCTDAAEGDISAKVVVSGLGFPALNTCGEYNVTYACANSQGVEAPPLTRTVRVEDNTCPVCTMNSGPTDVEASFTYTDPGAECTDSLDGSVPTQIGRLTALGVM